MDTLCNPVTGECSVSYDVPSEDKPVLEDKIVSVLGCIICLVNKGREDVLSGRSAIMNSYRDSELDLLESKLPPLAIFRGEMKRYCESLHVALEKFLTPDDARSVDVWTKLQRLKNVCYDSGVPRMVDQPCQTMFANWFPVYLSTSKVDSESPNSEIAFWKGGQVTEEGLKWLIGKGFRTIVDLRAETIKDKFYEVVLGEAISSKNIELVKLPVEIGTAPTMEQVDNFAALVSNSSRRPIYLHSKEGVWRTSAMVSRWRQFVSHYQPNQLVASSDSLLKNSEKTEEGSNSSSVLEGTENGESQNIKESSGNDMRAKSVPSSNTTGVHFPTSSQQNTKCTAVDNEIHPLIGFRCEVNPLECQLPPSNVFSRKEMSMFFNTKKVSPTTYFNHERIRLKTLSAEYTTNEPIKRNAMVGTKSPYRLMERKSLNGSSRQGNVSSTPQGSPVNNEKDQGDKYISAPRLNAIESKRFYRTEKDDIVSVRNELYNNRESTPTTHSRSTQNGSSMSVGKDELILIEGDMCASATGVVRVQSRKKAEMFLVRTDGFSCTREKVTESSLAFTHPSTQQQMLMWKSTPKTVLLLKKLGQELMEQAKEVASFLHHQENMNVLVEPEVHDIFARIPGFGFVQTFYSQDTSDLHERVDFVACLGGDGVILHASNLFRGAVPPVVSFNLGSLGFLTSHAFEDYKKDLRLIIHGNNTLDGVYITLRMRLRCEIFRNGKAMPGKVFDVLNEIVVDRGSNPYLSKIECYEHDRLITKVQGDGVIVATPTGSTAYSTAAGGSMVHPNVPCMLFTPICPHSLSFRPVVLPDSARLELKIPEDARSNAWVSFDGKRRQQLSRGDSVRISMSQHPLPTVNKYDQTGDWFHSLIRCLNWNERQDQKAL
ncbi:hypothetical protein Leryth_024673 [Lithospermum erythrorhizon]|nr:hypothetical protein Leryth_024673 [Lithospermum erythrorhizon]